ncbi:protein G of Na+/H+ antiporter of putative pH adaptation potassium efflux system [Taylorella asinigenitalis 14/45]|uniref:Na(+) H(+) antiporter subunit G n=2 Tax=Taylorella asinigenitalis TaxID=84590 RepID=G4Q9L2_TAYAM|nr:monovalent cation/H(+) antiporter subunit G [Taylorella asinigenitalis]AEP36628.1 Na(+) H(+) antiporter subunit G [Taylorella asinigenitalis MCE3]CCG18880.1 protein G of Na+/H+ antiporter of putative pH adaptation potassium efflux system [Taylorella asinigenitalis 14/45]
MNDIPVWVAVLIAIFLVFGSTITMIGSIGLVRFRSFSSRVHATALGSTLGTLLVMISSMTLSYYLHDRVFFHEIILVLVLFLTSPISTSLMLRSYTLRMERLGNHE